MEVPGKPPPPVQPCGSRHSLCGGGGGRSRQCLGRLFGLQRRRGRADEAELPLLNGFGSLRIWPFAGSLTWGWRGGERDRQQEGKTVLLRGSLSEAAALFHVGVRFPLSPPAKHSGLSARWVPEGRMVILHSSSLPPSALCLSCPLLQSSQGWKQWRLGTWLKGMTRRGFWSCGCGSMFLPFRSAEHVADLVQDLWFQQRGDREAPLSENQLPLGCFKLDSSAINCLYQKAKLAWEAADRASQRVCESDNSATALFTQQLHSYFTSAWKAEKYNLHLQNKSK